VLTECFKPPGVDRNEISYAEIGETPGVPGGNSHVAPLARRKGAMRDLLATKLPRASRDEV